MKISKEESALKIYTRTGDTGQTGVIGGRVSKDDARVEACGTIDELNSFLGQAIHSMEGDRYADMREDLLLVQHELFDCGSDLAYLGTSHPYKVSAEMTERLERWIDRYDAETPDITRFILPGGSRVSCALHICRTVCRRAERRVVTLSAAQEINKEILRYLNRLSDLFFTMARAANCREQVPDVEYIRGGEVFRRQ